jgi:hypothetical protein
MGDPQVRPQRATVNDGELVVYDFHIDIEVKTPSLDEKRLQQLIDERIRLLAQQLRNGSP